MKGIFQSDVIEINRLLNLWVVSGYITLAPIFNLLCPLYLKFTSSKFKSELFLSAVVHSQLSDPSELNTRHSSA